MRRYIVLLLITGIVWAQTDFDRLVLKNGTTYFGEYSKIEEEIVYFKPQDAFAFQPISIKQVERLKLKDGRVAVLNSNVISLTFEEYQKLRKNTNAAVIIGCIIVVAVLVATWPGIGGSSGDICFDPRCD